MSNYDNSLHVNDYAEPILRMMSQHQPARAASGMEWYYCFIYISRYRLGFRGNEDE